MQRALDAIVIPCSWTAFGPDELDRAERQAHEEGERALSAVARAAVDALRVPGAQPLAVLARFHADALACVDQHPLLAALDSSEATWRFFAVLAEATGVKDADRLWAFAAHGLLQRPPRATEACASAWATQMGTTAATVLDELAALSAALGRELAAHGAVEVPGFGCFSSRRLREVKGTDPVDLADRVRALQSGTLARAPAVRVVFSSEEGARAALTGVPLALGGDWARWAPLLAVVLDDARQHGPVELVGVGVVVVTELAGYEGRNPRTGAVVVVPPKWQLQVLASEALERAVPLG